MWRTSFLLLAAASLLPTSGVAQQATLDPDSLKGLRWRTIGPDGNRLSAAVGEWGNPEVLYFGAASGGIWKSSDGGTSWEAVFDDQEAASIGSLAVSPSDPAEVWAGTGETFIIRPALAMGNGIYRSTDGGRSFHHRGLEATGRIGRIVVHPTNPDLVYACALGHSYAPQPERGVYRTVDGGDSWELVLQVDEHTGCADLAIDLEHPDRLLAGMWQLRIDTHGLKSGGPGSGVYRSRDGGDTWERLSGGGKGLPGGADHPIGKVAVGIAPSAPDRWYALIEDTSPGFYRSDDGGDSWELVLTHHDLAERAPYYVRFALDPEDANRVYFASVLFSTSVDGGSSLVETSYRAGGDNHDVWVDPRDPDRILVAHDGGGSISTNRGETWRRIVPPVAQMYQGERGRPDPLPGVREPPGRVFLPGAQPDHRRRDPARPLARRRGLRERLGPPRNPAPTTSSGRVATTAGSRCTTTAPGTPAMCASGRKRATAGRRRISASAGTGTSRWSSRGTSRGRPGWAASSSTGAATAASRGRRSAPT